MSKIVRMSTRRRQQVEDASTMLSKLFPSFPAAMLKVLLLRYREAQAVEEFLVDRGWKRNTEVLSHVNKLRQEEEDKKDVHVKTRYYHGWYGSDCLELLRSKPAGAFMTVVEVRDGSFGYHVLFKNAKGECHFRRLEQPSPIVTKRQAANYSLTSPIERPERRRVCRACKTGPCKLLPNAAKKKKLKSSSSSSSSSSDGPKAHVEVVCTYPIYIPSQKILMAQPKGF